MAWKCFLVEHRGEMVVRLTRLAMNRYCPHDQTGLRFCRTEVPVGRAPALWDEKEDGYRFHRSPDLEPWLLDYRWPTHCTCGYEFVDSDARQMNHELIYVGLDGREYEMHRMPIGAMFENGWDRKGPDGKSMTVVLPPGRPYDFWNIDGRATGGGYWTRTGAPPDLTVIPSIKSGAYHGFLGSSTAPAPGWLSDPLGDSVMLQTG